MVETADRRRSAEIRVKLSPAMAEEFGKIAEARGLLAATLAAAALGEYVEKYRRDIQMQRMVAVDVSRRMTEVVVGEGKLDEAIARVLGDPQILAVMSQAPGV